MEEQYAKIVGMGIVKPGGGTFSPYMEIVLLYHSEDEAMVPYI